MHLGLIQDLPTSACRQHCHSFAAYNATDLSIYKVSLRIWALHNTYLRMPAGTHSRRRLVDSRDRMARPHPLSVSQLALWVVGAVITRGEGAHRPITHLRHCDSGAPRPGRRS